MSDRTGTELPRMSAAVAEATSHDPDAKGHFGAYGGRLVPEALMAVIEEVTAAYDKVRTDQTFLDELDRLQQHYTGRPSPLYEASRLSEHAGGARLFLKREDLNHTGSHKINNVLGQALLAKRMGKTRVIAETGAGQHGVATATACALLGLECVIYMGAVDTARQALNVARMRSSASWIPESVRRNNFEPAAVSSAGRARPFSTVGGRVTRFRSCSPRRTRFIACRVTLMFRARSALDAPGAFWSIRRQMYSGKVRPSGPRTVSVISLRRAMCRRCIRYPSGGSTAMYVSLLDTMRFGG